MNQDNPAIGTAKTHFFLLYTIANPRNRNCPPSYRIGIHWETLLKDNIPVKQLNYLFKKEMKSIYNKNPSFRWNGARNLRNYCNYIAPAGVWARELKFDIDTFIHALIPRINNLFTHGILSSQMAAQLLRGILNEYAERYQNPRAFIWMASRLVDGSIITFKRILEDSARLYKYENFFSFIFNHYQRLLGNYGISVSRKLVDFKLPLDFLKNIYFKHQNNEEARQDLWSWGIAKQDFFGEKFYAYWQDNGYAQTEVNKFENSVLPYLGPYEDESEYDEPQRPHTVVYQLSPSPLLLSTPFLSSVHGQQALSTMLVLYFLPPAVEHNTPFIYRVAHVGEQNPENTAAPAAHIISPQLKNSLRTGNFSTYRPGFLVGQAHALDNQVLPEAKTYFYPS